MALVIQESVPLAALTTLELGGPARFFVDIEDEAQLIEALRWADKHQHPVFALGGGSNLVVADEGFQGLVVRLRLRGLAISQRGDDLLLTARAGESWDDVVAAAVDRNAAGIECLSGIPGLAGAAPVQNIGAYGQEVADVLTSVRVLDKQTMDIRVLDRDACDFGYRTSLFRRQPERFVILDLTLRLAVGAPAALRYDELAEALVGTPTPSLDDVRATVLDLRTKKSMLLDTADDNRRSAGSFFTNPILRGEEASQLAARAAKLGLIRSRLDLPCYAQPDGRIKLAAAWLIERSGIAKGLRMGNVGISSKHALALVHHGGGTTAELLRLAIHVRDTVRERFGVTLVPEPIFLGLTWPA